MKRLLLLLLLILLLLIGCNPTKQLPYEMDEPTKPITQKDFTHIVTLMRDVAPPVDNLYYFHDEERKVGVWLVTPSRRDVPVIIFVLPDSQYEVTE